MITKSAGIERSHHVVAASDAARQMAEQIAVAARSPLPAAFAGPTGSGKKHAARAVHNLSSAADGPFETFSARGVEPHAHAQHLFGSQPSTETQGHVGAAAGGSLLIDGFDQLAAAARSQLLDLLKKQSAPTRAQAPTRVLLTSTTEVDLPDITIQNVRVHPLSERPECILPLAAHFLAIFASHEDVEPVGFTSDARRSLLEEAWAGNIRELRERIRHAVRLAGSGAISAEALLLANEGDEVLPFKQAKRAFETRYVESLLRRCRGNISRAARLAQKDRKDFYDVIRRTGVDPSQFRN